MYICMVYNGMLTSWTTIVAYIAWFCGTIMVRMLSWWIQWIQPTSVYVQWPNEREWSEWKEYVLMVIYVMRSINFCFFLEYYLCFLFFRSPFPYANTYPGSSFPMLVMRSPIFFRFLLRLEENKTEYIIYMATCVL